METERHKEEVRSAFAIQIAKLEFAIARLRLVEALATRGRANGGTRAILRHYLWLWDEVTPTPEGMYAHDIKEAFKDECENIVVLDLTQFQYE